ncbi:hypothetical protein NE237_007921 [Protea cynaroides]|uniref:Uncharacterized protein n=1 Tax=Protea cynaroides TaxID=273540 RepID=A0A9Q0KQC2_9MAGN|nr:hypothetical protein NE237_007921 [Protea cynaroides]
MSWFVGILKRVFVWEENESSDRRNPRYSDHGISSVNVGVSYPRAPSGFTPSKPPSSINQCQSSSGSPASISKLPTSSSNLSPSSSLLGPQNTAGSFTPTKPPSSINQCQSSSGSPASISKLPTSSSNLSPSSSLLDIVPEVLKKPVSPSTYRDYFAALLYAEDFYTERWSNFCLTNVNLELHQASIYKKSTKSNAGGLSD